jgi:CBS domain-containing protein
MNHSARSHQPSRHRRTLRADGTVSVEPTSSKLPQARGASAGSSASETPVSEIMTAEVICVAPDVPLEALLALMIERGISGVPVVNERGLPVGMVSKTDLVRYRYENGDTSSLDETTVSEVMLPIAHTVLEGTSLAHAAALMAWEGIHRLPVCGERGDVVGMLSALDLVRWMSRREGYSARRVGALSAPLVDDAPVSST